MKVLVIGQGGREHALVRALRLSPQVTEIHAIPGSPGMEKEALCHEVDLHDFNAVCEFARKKQIDFSVIGPEAHLVTGLTDALREAGFAVVGPNKSGARLEGSKIFSKEYMTKAGVPTSDFFVVQSVDECMNATARFTKPYVLKADGLAAGKGVFICKDEIELRAAAVDLFENRSLGEAGAKAVLEQYQEGYELSYLLLTNGQTYQALPLSQDHKRLLEGGKGPNTGGMGVVAPLKISDELEQRIHKQILEPSVKYLSEVDPHYRGILYVGVIVSNNNPFVLEYNVRFGDPEAQAVLPLLDGDWGVVFHDLAHGKVKELNWKPLYSACVVLAAEGYPQRPIKGVQIEGDLSFETPSSYFLHAGTKKGSDGHWQTNGGRVLNAIGIGSSITEARELAYKQANAVTWHGCQMRKDIDMRTD